MAIRNLTNWSDPIFRKQSRAVEKFDERLWVLLDDMRETLEKVNGYGCAITINGSDFLAATFCHEIDHLNGILFTDKAVEVI
ncbi:MAG: peptide deformylase [Clostridiales bacterium]|nr:peptide deformylase [Clostridiales bacterium]